MTLVDTIGAILMTGVVAYAVFAGADFGAGLWDLLAGGTERGGATRRLIDRSIGPVWEANHVWLIFILVVLWTAFPEAFAAQMRTLIIPWLAAGVGIVLRGGAFVFRKYASTLAAARLHGFAFAVSSIVTPFFFGTIAGAIASGRVPATGGGDRWTSWTGPTSLLGGVLAVLTTAFVAAVFLTRDAAQEGDHELAEQLRGRALATAVVTGVVALGGIFVLATDAPTLSDGLVGRGAPLVGLSALGGATTIWALWQRQYGRARIAAALSVATVVLGWGVAQYPWLEVDQVTLAEAAAAPPVLWGLVIGFGIAVVVVVPSLVLLLYLVEQGTLREPPFDPVTGHDAVRPTATTGHE